MFEWEANCCKDCEVIYVSILMVATGEEGMTNLYIAIFSSSIHIATAKKFSRYITFSRYNSFSSKIIVLTTARVA